MSSPDVLELHDENMSLGEENTEYTPSVQVISFIPGMECPACPEKQYFTNCHAFDRHWTACHRPRTTTFFCPVDKCKSSFIRFGELTRHYSSTHAGKRGNPTNPMVVCRRARTKVAENRSFVDPGCLVFKPKKDRKRSQSTRPALAERHVQAEPERKPSVVSQAQPEKVMMSPVRQAPPEKPEIAETWELAYDRQTLEIQALKYELEQMSRRLNSAVPAWPTLADVPLSRPGLDEFIRAGREAMTILHQAEDRRFMEQLTLRRQADAFIHSLQGKDV